jgi:TrwC relaxase
VVGILVELVVAEAASGVHFHRCPRPAHPPKAPPAHGKIAFGQHRYYEQQVAQGADDYYAGRGEAPGEWSGAGAKALGLSGRVSPDQFHALIAGRDPNS